jgi:hypothetical protein
MPYHSGHNDWSHVQPGYTLLAFDHFKLLFDCGVEKEIITGYKVLKPLYGKNDGIKVGQVVEKHAPMYTWYQANGNEGQSIPMELVENNPEYFEPIYKSPEVIIQVGACKIPVHVVPGKRIFAKHGEKEIEIDKEMLDGMIGHDWYSLRIMPCVFAVTLGNETLKDVTLEEINKVIETYNSK